VSSKLAREAHEARAMELANLGIESQAAGDYEAARHAWQEALNYAEQHLPGDSVLSWIRSGLGNALLKTGDYPGALEMAGSALEFCASVRAPLASLTMVEAYLRLGDVTCAQEYARQACDLRGERTLEVLSLEDRAALGVATPP